MKSTLTKWACAATAVTGLFLIPAGQAQLAKGEKDTIAIAPLKVKPSVTEVAKAQNQSLPLGRVKDSLEAQFQSSVAATRIFQVVERQRVDELKLEQAFAAVEVDPNDKNAAQAMKMAGAKFIFMPELDGFQDRMEANEMAMSGEREIMQVVFASMTVRIVDATTGKYLPDVPSEQMTLTRSYVAGSGTAQTSVFREQMYAEISTQLAKKLTIRVISLLRPAKILTVTGAQVMINRGSDLGFEPGAQVGIFATQEVKDDDTGEIFQNEVPVGKAQIERGDPRQSFATLVGENLGVAKGCIVKITGFAPQPGQPQMPAPGMAPMSGAAPAPMLEPPPAQPPPTGAAPGVSSEKPFTWEGNTQALPDDPNAIKNVKFTHQKLQKAIRVLGVNQGLVDNLLKVVVHISARDKISARYKFVFYNADGAELEPGKAAWKPIFFAGNQNITVQGISPNPSGRSFQLFLEPAE